MSHTYPVPGSEGEYPSPRYPGIRLRVVPNESLGDPWIGHLGELVQALVDVGADEGISVELDTSDHTRPGEMRGGASPMASLALVLLSGIAGGATGRIGDQLLDAAVEWVRRHIKRRQPTDTVSVTLYGPDGEVMKRIEIDPDENQ